MASKIIRRTSKKSQEFIKAGNNGRLLGSLEQFLLTEPPEFRSQAVLHPSEMAKPDWCVRKGYYQLALDDAGRTPPGEINSLQRQNIFDEGHYIHDKWQQRFWRQGILYGKFCCIACGGSWWATSPEVCPYSKHTREFLRYKEVPLGDEAARIGGHSDGWIKDSQGDAAIEIKSVGIGTYRFEAKQMIRDWGEDMTALWRATRRPFASHVRQGQIYLRLMNQNHDVAPQDMVFIYENKSNQQYKEFVVPYDPSATDALFEGAADIVARLSNGDGPPACPQGDEGCKDCKPLEGSI